MIDSSTGGESGEFGKGGRGGRGGRGGAAARTTELTGVIVDAGLKVHRTLGPGLLESVYEECLTHELSRRSLVVQRQLWLPIEFEGVRLKTGYRLDLVVEDDVIVEIKAVDALAGIHKAQLLTYLRLSGFSVGLLINFNVELFKDGVRRVVAQTT
jgi:GxxExxY protein